MKVVPGTIWPVCRSLGWTIVSNEMDEGVAMTYLVIDICGLEEFELHGDVDANS